MAYSLEFLNKILVLNRFKCIWWQRKIRLNPWYNLRIRYHILLNKKRGYIHIQIYETKNQRGETNRNEWIHYRYPNLNISFSKCCNQVTHILVTNSHGPLKRKVQNISKFQRKKDGVNYQHIKIATQTRPMPTEKYFELTCAWWTPIKIYYCHLNCFEISIHLILKLCGTENNWICQK